jgi:hypothetical protein
MSVMEQNVVYLGMSASLAVVRYISLRAFDDFIAIAPAGHDADNRRD